MKAMWLAVKFRKASGSADEVWRRIPHENASCFERGDDCLITYTGDKARGVEILEKALEEGHCHVRAICGY